MAEDRAYDIASLCFDVRGQKFVVIVGSQISKLATERKAASFFELLQLGVKRAVDIKFKANANPEERREYKDGLFALIPTNPLHVADEIYSQLHEVCFFQWLRQEFRAFKIRNPQPTSTLKCLQKVGGRLLTTNYDLVLEKSKLPPKFGGEVHESDRPLNILVEGDYEDIEEVIAGPKQAILHLFGTYESQFVFTTSDHDNYSSNADAMAHLQSIFYHSHVLFVGFEKDDPFLNTLYKVMMNELRMEKRLGSTRNRHYILVPDSDVRTFSDHFRGVLPVPYGSSPDELVNFLKMILEAIDSHKRGQKRRKDDDEDNGDLPAGIKRAHLISEDYSAISPTADRVPEFFNIPKDKVQFGADIGTFASIHFSIDVPEEYIPRIWDEALRSDNLFFKCGIMAIQIGTGPMLWMREHHGPEQPVCGQQGDGMANQGEGAWIKPKRRAWHRLPDCKPFEIKQQVKVSVRNREDQAKAYFTNLKRVLKERFGCSSVYRWSQNFVTFVCQGRAESVKPAVKFLQQSQGHISKQYSKRDKSDRQFACEDCDVVWWAYVPKNNAVTLCPKCNTCYKALKHWDQYGYADFECNNCGQKFEGSDRFSKWSSIECPECSETVKPYRICRPHQKRLTVKQPSALTLSPYTTKRSVQKNVQPRQIPDKHSSNEQVGSTKKPREQKQTPKSLTKDAQEILTIWPKSSRSARVEDTAKTDDTSEASSVHPKPLHHPFTLKDGGKPESSLSLFQDQVSDLQPELLRSKEEKSKPAQRNRPPISRSKYQMKKERELQRKSVSRRRKFSTRMYSTSNVTRKDSSTPPVVSEVCKQDRRYAPKIAKGELLSEPSNQQLLVEQNKHFPATPAGELPEVVLKLFGELPASTSISGHSDTAATSINNREFPGERSHIAHSSASGFSPNVLRKLKLFEESPEAGTLVPDAALNDRKGSMEESLTSRPLLRALISSSNTTPETTGTNHSTAGIGFMPTAQPEIQNFLTSEMATKLVSTTAAARATGSKSNAFQEMVFEVDTQKASNSTATDVHIDTAQHPMESYMECEWPDLESLPSESRFEAKPSDVELVPSSEIQMVHSGIPSNSQNSIVEVTYGVEANRIVQTAINNALERVGDKQKCCISRTQDFKSNARVLSPEVLTVDDMRPASHNFTQRPTCTHGGSNLDVTNSVMSLESDLVPLPSSESQDTKENFILPLPGGVFHPPDQTDKNQPKIPTEKRPGEETAKTDFMYDKLQGPVQNFSSEQVRERSHSRTEISQEVGADAASLDMTNFCTSTTAVDESLGNEKSCSLDTVVSGETIFKEPEFPTVELVPEIQQNNAAEACKLHVHKITVASAHGVYTTSVYSEVKAEELQRGEGSLRSGAHDTFLLKPGEDKDHSTPSNKSDKDSRIQVSTCSEEFLGEEPLASPLGLEARENSGQSVLPNELNASSFGAHLSSENLEPQSKVVFDVSSDLVGEKNVVKNYPNMLESFNPAAFVTPSETSIKEISQPFSEVDDIGNQSSPFVRDMNVERDTEDCKVHVPEISVACSNPNEDADYSLGEVRSEEHQTLNDTHTTAATGLSASASSKVSYEIGIPSDDSGYPIPIILEQQSQFSELHASAQPDSTINTDTDPHSSNPGPSNTRTGKVADAEKAEVVMNRLEDASTLVRRSTDSTMAQPPYSRRPETSESCGEDVSDSEESHLQTSKEPLDPLEVCSIAKERSTVKQTLVEPRTSKSEAITMNREVNPQEEDMPCIDNGLEPHPTLISDQGRSQVTECEVCETGLVLDILDDIIEAAVQESNHVCALHSMCNPEEQEQPSEFGSFSPVAKTIASPSSSPHTGKVAHAEQAEVVIDRLEDSTDTSELVQRTLDSSMAQPPCSADIASPQMRPETSEPGGEDVSDSEESHLQTSKEQLDPLEVCSIAKERSTVKQTLVEPRTSKSEAITMNREVNPCIDNGIEPHSTLIIDQGRTQVTECKVCETGLVLDTLDDIIEAAVQEGDHTCVPHSICDPKEQEQLSEFGSFSPVSQQEEIRASLEEETKTIASPSSSPHTSKVEVIIEDSTDTSGLVHATSDSSMAQPHCSADIASPQMRPETSEPGGEDVSDSEESHLQTSKEQLDPLEVCLIAKERSTVKQTLVESRTSKPKAITMNREVNPCIDNGLEPHSTLISDQGRTQVTECEVCETGLVLDILDDIIEAAVQEGDHTCVPHSICDPKEHEQLSEFGSFSPVSQQEEIIASPSCSPHTSKVEMIFEDSTDTSGLVQGTPDSSMAQPHCSADIASPQMRPETSEPGGGDISVSEKAYLQTIKEQLDPVCLVAAKMISFRETRDKPSTSKHEEIPLNVEANSQEEGVPCINNRLDSFALSIDQGKSLVTECEVSKTELVLNDTVEAAVQEGDHACVPSDICNPKEQEQLPEDSSFSPVSQRDEQEPRSNSPHTGKVACVELTEAVIGRPEDSTDTSPGSRSPDSPTAQPPPGNADTTTPETKPKPPSESGREDFEDPEESHLQSSKEDDPLEEFLVTGETLSTAEETLEGPRILKFQLNTEKNPQENDIPEPCFQNGLGLHSTPSGDQRSLHVTNGVAHETLESVVQEGDCVCIPHDTCYPTEQEQLPEVGSYSPVSQQDEIRASRERESKINPSSSPRTGEVAHAEKTEKVAILTDTSKLVQKGPDSPIAQSGTYTEHPKMFPPESGVDDIKVLEESNLQEQIDDPSLSTTSEEPKPEDIPNVDSKRNPSESHVKNGLGFQSTQTIGQSGVGTTECKSVHGIALDILNDIIYAVIQKCHACIPLDDHEPEEQTQPLPELTPISTPEPDNKQGHGVSEKADTNGSCPLADLIAAAKSSLSVVASGIPDEDIIHQASPDSPRTPKPGIDFGRNESSPFASEENKGMVETKVIEVGDGYESSTVSAKESKSSIAGMSPPYSETDNESESSGSDGYEQDGYEQDGYEQDASETEGEQVVQTSSTASQTPQDVATIEIGYTLEPQEESALDPWLSEPDVPKQDTSVPTTVKDSVHGHHRTVPSVVKKLELPYRSPPKVRTRTKKRPRYLSKFKDKDQKIRRNVYIPSERHNCTGDTDDETRSAGLQAIPVVFEFKQEHLYF